MTPGRREKIKRYRKRYPRSSSNGAQLTAIYKRDRGICWICKEWTSRDDASRDHVVPVSLGGKDTDANLKLAHKKCNSSRGNRSIDEYLSVVDWYIHPAYLSSKREDRLIEQADKEPDCFD